MTGEEPTRPSLYDDLASWWPLLSHPADYQEEAAFFARPLLEAGEPPARTLLELGSGGGNNASHLKRQFDMVLVDPDPADITYTAEYAYLLREPDGGVRVEHDRHVLGFFGRDEWLELLRETGFHPRVMPLEHSELEPGSHEVFLGVRPRT